MNKKTLQQIEMWKSEAVDMLINEDFSYEAPYYYDTGELVDWSTVINDVKIKDDGVYFPTYYRPTDDGYMPLHYTKRYTNDEFNKVYYELLQENMPEYFNEYVNLKTNKN